MTLDSARKKETESFQILPIYDHAEEAGEHRFLSNFTTHAPFSFEIPTCCTERHPKLEITNTVKCFSSEKAIMLCKARVMGDAEGFHKIVGEEDPKKVKELGRKIENFEQEVWDKVLEKVTLEVCRQKFEKVPGLKEILLKTGSKVIVRASPWDGILDLDSPWDDPKVLDPSMWQGRNVLGTALMKTRKALGGTGEPPMLLRRAEWKHDNTPVVAAAAKQGKDDGEKSQQKKRTQGGEGERAKRSVAPMLTNILLRDYKSVTGLTTSQMTAPLGTQSTGAARMAASLSLRDPCEDPYAQLNNMGSGV